VNTRETQQETAKWPRIAVVGAGAVGGYYGGMLARAGAPVVLIGRPSFAEAVKTRGLRLDTLAFKESVSVEASTELSAVRGAELVLLCVKTIDTAATARALAPFLGAGARVLSLQNGVDAVEQIQNAARLQALQTVVYVAASVPEPGLVKHVGRGDLVIGPETTETRALAALFERAGIPCRLSPNIEGELWAKFVCNCALNAVSALGRANYGRLAADADALTLLGTLVEEVMAVARASQIVIPSMETVEKAKAAVLALTTQISAASSSTAQDMSRGKPTEIASLNGFVARRGRALGVPTPVNHALFTLVSLAEKRA
jgi:2-dehydropantoate 2-reductase